MNRLDPLTLPLDRRVLIEASAGTGKTFTIAALYVRLVLGHQVARPLLPQEILVVTFTDAATSELKSRIRARLSQAARYFADESHEADDFLTTLRQHFAPALWPLCAQRLQLAAQSMDEACISTIHGWCNRMLTEHAFASGAAFGRELITDEMLLWQQASQDYWRAQVYAMSMAEFQRYVRTYRSPDALCLDAMRLQDVVVDAVPESPAALIAKELRDKAAALLAIKAPWARWIDELAALIEDGRSKGLTNNSKLRADYVAKWWDKLRSWQQSDDDGLPDIGSGLSRLTPDGLADAWKGPAPTHEALDAMALLPAALAALPNVTTSLRHHASTAVGLQVAQRKQQQRQLGFNDLLAQLAQALQQSAELAAVIQQQFPLALIDEFQDTDPLQYGIFNRIYAQRGALILIGDPKQAIYGFRGADIYTYLQAKHESPLLYSLGTNYRSTTAVVDSVNRLFLLAEQRDSGLGAFMFRDHDNLVPFEPVQAHGKTTELRVQGEPVPAMLMRYTQTDKPLSKTAWLAQAAELCVERIAYLLTQAAHGECGFYHVDHPCTPLQSRDIAVLVNNQREADAIRSRLQQRGIRSVYLSDKGSVFDSPIASQVALWLNAVLDPRQQLVRNALATPALGQSLATIDALTDDDWDRLQQQFSHYALVWQRQGVQPMLTQLMFDFAVVSSLAALPNAERLLTDLLQLADLLQQASRMLDGERALVRYLHEHLQGEGELSGDATRLQLESDDALVRVVTIHKSKGLEYPCVFLPFLLLSREIDASQTPLRVHGDQGQLQVDFNPSEQVVAQAERERLAEDLRKLYVALTRACYHCHIEVAALSEKSALAYLFSADGVLAPSQLAHYGATVADGNVIAFEQAAEPTLSKVPLTSTDDALQHDYLRHGPQARSRWWFASYSALTVADDDDGASKARQLHFELSSAPQPDEPPSPAADFASQLLKGAHIGTFLHEQLEWAAKTGFATVAADASLWWQQLPASALRAGLLTPGEAQVTRQLLQQDHDEPPVFASAEQALAPLKNWLDELVQRRLPVLDASLAEVNQTVAELEFWLPVSKLAVRQLDLLICQHIWPDEPRPALLEGQLNGMLKGFIDLLIEQQNRYYVMDFKSNFLASYQESALKQAVLAKRYDVQAVLYVFALYRLLQSRGVTAARQALGPALYWFLRGTAEPNCGVVRIDVPDLLILRLDQWFRETGDAS